MTVPADTSELRLLSDIAAGSSGIRAASASLPAGCVSLALSPTAACLASLHEPGEECSIPSEKKLWEKLVRRKKGVTSTRAPKLGLMPSQCDP